MGDPKRFHLFANLIQSYYSFKHYRIADVASGKGYLQAAMRQLGYTQIESWDIRKRNAKNRRGYRYGLFDYRKAPDDYNLVVAMHPDGGTDHAIMYAATRRVPFVVCPCCAIGSAVTYWGPNKFWKWLEHLKEIAKANRMRVEIEKLPMSGRNLVMIGRPI